MKIVLGRIKASLTYRCRVALIRVLAVLQRLETPVPLKVETDSRLLMTYKSPAPSISIVVTTFQARQERYCTPLVKNLRNFGCTIPVIVVVNGETDGSLDPVRRMNFVKSLVDCADVHFVMFRQLVGLARLWNAGIQSAATDVCVILNDDLLAVSRDCVQDIRALAEGALQSGLSIGNGSWSHFGITRNTIRDVGWFDERYLGFGEEDGDYSWRFRTMYGRYPKGLPLTGLSNVKDGQRSHYATGTGKYTLQNRVLASLKYSSPDEMSLEMEPPPLIRASTPNFYPGEEFRSEHGYLLDERNERRIADVLSKSLGLE